MKKVIIISLLAMYAFAGMAQNADAISGIWWNDKKTSKIKVEKKDGKYIGTVVYLLPEKYIDGKSPVDDQNPDTKLQSRPIVGLQILSGFVYDAGKKQWKSGRIYDPDAGKTYDCYAWLEGDVLKLKGFVLGIRWMGRESEWYKTTL